MNTPTAIAIVFTVSIVFGIPFLGLTIRYALKPVVDAWLRMREAQLVTSPTELTLLRERVAHLERVLEAHGLMDAHSLTVRPGLPERLPSSVPLKDRERV